MNAHLCREGTQPAKERVSVHHACVLGAHEHNLSTVKRLDAVLDPGGTGVEEPQLSFLLCEIWNAGIWAIARPMVYELAVGEQHGTVVELPAGCRKSECLKNVIWNGQ
jgi:hypothetical protein